MFEPDELKYLTAAEITELHDVTIAQSGGLAGARPDLSVAALVGRIESNLTYERFENVAEIAALYAEVIARGHVFLDGDQSESRRTVLEGAGHI